MHSQTEGSALTEGDERLRRQEAGIRGRLIDYSSLGAEKFGIQIRRPRILCMLAAASTC